MFREKATSSAEKEINSKTSFRRQFNKIRFIIGHPSTLTPPPRTLDLQMTPQAILTALASLEIWDVVEMTRSLLRVSKMVPLLLCGAWLPKMIKNTSRQVVIRCSHI